MSKLTPLYYMVALVLPLIFLTHQFNERHQVLTYVLTAGIWVGASYLATKWVDQNNAWKWVITSILLGLVEAGMLIWLV